ncbi:hypothetical protein ID866_7030 [Astraeus odoratus]|nr:hypothetical protein ID866_7030 [Astraeus odoratus]
MTTTTLSAFSASGEEAIGRSIDLASSISAQRSASQDLLEFYEIERTAKEIRDGGFKRIALQFPDELLHESVPVYRSLKQRVNEGQELYLLADTSYGSCCVDEVAAQHVDADLMVHYGHACLSQADPTAPRPESDGGTMPDPACLQQTADTITNQNESNPALEHDNDIIVYIGEESLTLTNILITHSSTEADKQVYSYNPATSTLRLESGHTNKLLMRRFAVVQKARDADVFGILVGTLGVASYLSVINYLRTLLSRSRKKSYTISVGKLNPAKLANFMEIECFVLAACPENSIIESKDFFKPIITPHELRVALQPEGTWLGRYILEFNQLITDDGLETTSTTVERPRSGEEDEEDPDRPSFSLITGRFRQARRFGVGDKQEHTNDTDSVATVVLRNQEGSLSKLSDSAAAMFLESRVYRGLEARIGEDMPSVLEQGRSGIARGYTDDHPVADT